MKLLNSSHLPLIGILVRVLLEAHPETSRSKQTGCWKDKGMLQGSEGVKGGVAGSHGKGLLSSLLPLEVTGN